MFSEDSEGDTDNDEFSKERENELYSVLHYNDFSQGIPQELLEKYSITSGKHNEFLISFKNSSEEQHKPPDRHAGSKPAVLCSEDGKKKHSELSDAHNQVSFNSSSDEDVVVVELRPKNKTIAHTRNKSAAETKTTLTQNSKSVESSSTRSIIGQRKSSSPEHVRSRLLNGSYHVDDTEGFISKGSASTARRPKKRKWDEDIDSTLATNNDETPTYSKAKMDNKPKNDKAFKDNKLNIESSARERTPKSPSNHKYDIETQVASPKGRTSSATLPIKLSTEEVVVDPHSDSDDSSCVVVENPECNRKISVSSTDSVIVLNQEVEEVALLSSEEEDSGFSLNTTEDIAYESDCNVSDVVESAQFQWEEVASPRTWTKEMRKYYNSSCNRLRYFDHKVIRQQIKTGNRRDWIISPKDLFPNNRHRQRCLICRQSDHMARNCPKKNPPCYMCGNEGHSNTDCPNSVCLQCGKRNRQFTSVCRSCTHTLSRECFTCNQTGHESRACPEKWREFHSTTEGPLNRVAAHDRNHKRQCCNCGNSNHSYEECNQQYMYNFAKSLPAYKWLHRNDGESGDWRCRFSGPSSGNSVEPPFKRRRYHHDRDSFQDEMPRWVHVAPASKPKKKKKKKPKRGRKMFLP